MNSRRSYASSLVLAFCLIAGSLAFSQSVPTPESFFGHKIGVEKKLARWDKIVEYMRLAAAASPRGH